MTGQKNRYSTTEKLWNLDDKQLKTPKHDAMVLWLLDKNNLKPLISSCKIQVGFSTIKEVICNEFYDEISITSEKPLMSSNTFVGGYADLFITPTINCKYAHFEIIIEVKPFIDSFGAVLRQIRTYGQFSRIGHRNLFLFTLDNRFDEQFESQGIHILHPPADFDIDEVISYYGL